MKVAPLWAWKSRNAARRYLRQNNQLDSIDMQFLNLRGHLVNAFNCSNYEAAETHLSNFLATSGMSRTELRKRLRVVGFCITTGKEEYRNLRTVLRNDDALHAKKRIVKAYTHLSLCLINLFEKHRMRQKKNDP